MIYLTFVIAGNTPNAPSPEIYRAAAQRFVRTYKAFPAGYDHKLMVIDSNGGFTAEMAQYFDGIEYEVLSYRANGWDIGAHQFAAFNMRADDWIMCFSSWAYFRKEGWLKAFVDARNEFGDGLFGSTSSFERNPHIRGTGFFVRCERIHRYPFGCNSREESFEFESGPNSLTLWCINQGYGAWLVTPGGTIPLEQSREPDNIFRRGDQSNIWTFDKHTDAYESSDKNKRIILSHASDFNRYPDSNMLDENYVDPDRLPVKPVEVRLGLKAMVSTKSWRPSDKFLERIQACYPKMKRPNRIDGSVIWDQIVPSKQNDLHEALIEGGDLLRETLTYPIRTNLFYGVDNLTSDFARNATPSDEMAIPLENDLYMLAVALGSCVLFNPEGGAAFPHKERPPRPGTENLLNSLPFKPSFPNPFEGEFGLVSSRGIISHQAIQAIYHAYSFKQACDRIGGRRYLEIGAGMGRAAYYCHSLGVKDYTIVDLPIAIVGQAIFLAAVLGESHVSLPGEDDQSVPGVIRLRSPDWLQTAGEGFDAVLNADAMTEMTRSDAQTYVDLIADKAGLFLSINHEANKFTVRQLLSHTPSTRHLYPLRAGYVEETYYAKELRPVEA